MFQKGQVYRTEGGLCAYILEISPLAIPKDITPAEKRRIKRKPHFSIEGYVFIEGQFKNKVRGSWTLAGKHSFEQNASEVGNLTGQTLPKLIPQRDFIPIDEKRLLASLGKEQSK